MAVIKLSLEDLDYLSDYIEQELESHNGKELTLTEYHTKKILITFDDEGNVIKLKEEDN